MSNIQQEFEKDFYKSDVHYLNSTELAKAIWGAKWFAEYAAKEATANPIVLECDETDHYVDAIIIEKLRSLSNNLTNKEK